MASVNKVILVGGLGKDPELKYTASGKAFAKFPLATTDTWNDEEKGKQERTEWHNITVWGRQAESCAQYLAKGRQVYVEGSIRSHSYDDKEGNKKYVTEINADRVQFLGGGPREQREQRNDGGFDNYDGQSGGEAPF